MHVYNKYPYLHFISFQVSTNTILYFSAKPCLVNIDYTRFIYVLLYSMLFFVCYVGYEYAMCNFTPIKLKTKQKTQTISINIPSQSIYHLNNYTISITIPSQSIYHVNSMSFNIKRQP